MNTLIKYLADRVGLTRQIQEQAAGDTLKLVAALLTKTHQTLPPYKSHSQTTEVAHEVLSELATQLSKTGSVNPDDFWTNVHASALARREHYWEKSKRKLEQTGE